MPTSEHPTFRAVALRVGADVADRVARAIERGEVGWLERLDALLGTTATADAADAGRAMARRDRDTDPDAA